MKLADKMFNKVSRYRWRLFSGLARTGVILRENERRLAELRGRHAGESAVFLGMGPSLRPADLGRFAGYVTFACNKIYLAFDQTSWRPTYYTVNDLLVAENNAEEIRALQGPLKLYPWRIRRILGVEEGALYYGNHGGIRADDPEPSFTPDPLRGIRGGGATVLLAQLQIAYWMGIKTACIVGLDFSFEVPKATGATTSAGEAVVSSEGEVNHFHKDYRKPGERWSMPRMEEQRVAFVYARKAYERDGRRILNASRQTKLEVLERVDFEETFPAV